MTKVVISGYYGYKNFGDEAILSVLVEHLKQNNCEITVLSGNPEYTRKKDDVYSIKNFDIKKVIETIRNNDILISGGGSLLQDQTSLKSLIYYAFIIFLAQFFKKKTIIFAQGIGPLNSNISRFLVKTLLEKCAITTVRDNKSQQLLENWGIDTKTVCDPIFSMHMPEAQKTNTVVIQLREFPTLTEKFLQDLAYYVSKYYSDKEIKILSLQDSKDLDICNHFNNLLKEQNNDINSKVISNLENHDIIKHISLAETLIAMRFHAILVGLKSRTKTLAINYDIKVEKLAEDFSIPILHLDKENNFDSEFTNLACQNLQQIENQAKTKIFDWSDIDGVLK